MGVVLGVLPAVSFGEKHRPSRGTFSADVVTALRNIPKMIDQRLQFVWAFVGAGACRATSPIRSDRLA
jgi:hypothetical protein